MVVRIQQVRNTKKGDRLKKPYFVLFNGKRFGVRYGSEEAARKVADEMNRR